MRSLKAKQGIALFAAALVVIATFIAPTAAVAAAVESRGVYVDASGRAGSLIVVTVMSKLPAGSTSTTDVGFAYLTNGPGGVTTYSGNFSYSATPFKIVNSIAYYKITLNAGPSVGAYVVRAGVASTGTSDYSAATASGNRSGDSYFKVGGTAVTVKFASRELKVSPSVSTNITDLSPSGFVLFDAEGVRTLLSDTETVQISTVSAPVAGTPVFALGSDERTATSGSPTLGFSATNNNGDGIYRFKVGNSVAGSSVVRASLLADSTSVSTSNFTLFTGSSAVTGRTVQLLNKASYNSGRMYASGTDGKLYGWGTRLIGLSDAVTGIDIGLRNDVKPTLIDFPKVSGSLNLNYVEKLIRVNSGSGIHVLSDDGTLWATQNYSGISAEQAMSGTLEPVFTPNLDSNFISSVSEDSSLLLLSDGTVLKRAAGAWNFTSFDLSSVGNPTITQVARMSTSQTNLFLASNGKVYSSGSNTYGELGQGSDTATALGEVALPANRTVSKIYAGTRFGAMKMVDGSYWTWGDNRSGQQGKLAAEVPYSNTPRVVISPANFTIIDFRTEVVITLIGSNSAYYASEGAWSQSYFANLGVPSGEILSGASLSSYDEATYSWINSSLVSTSTGKIYQGSGPTGSCLLTTGRVRSDGQFGERWFIDPVQSGSKLLIDSTTTTAISGAISVKVNTPFTLQAANVKTNCYATSELTFAWDKDGNGSYETPDTPTVGDTGYLGLNASFNFTTAGRRNVTLGVTTPDSITLAIPFIIGVEPETRTSLAALDTSTASLASNGSTAIALTAAGGVYAWGYNNYGQLGVSTALYSTRNIAMPLTLPDTVTAVSVAVRGQTNLVIDSTGKVWGFGRGNYIDGSSNSFTTATRVTVLQSLKVRLISNNFVLTTDGRLFLWNPNGTALTAIPSLAGVYVTSFADRGNISGCGSSYSDPNYYQVDAVDTDGNLWSIPYSSNYLPGDAQKVSISGVTEVKGTSNRATVRTSAGEIYYSYFAGCAYGNVVKPTGATLVDVAPYTSESNMIAMTDTAKNVWTNSISQSTGVFQPGTWTKLSAIDSVRISPTDTPKLFSSAPNYIGFASGRIFSSVSNYYENGTCGNYNGSRLYSTGQFGNSFFQDNLTISGSTAYVGSGSAVNFSSGQTLAAQTGDNLIFKLSNPRSSCFTGSTQLSASADLDGNGSYETSLSATNESGTYAFIATTTAPTSGRRAFSFKLETPIGTSNIFIVNVGVYASVPNSSVTTRTKAFNTSYNTSFAVGTDGFGYAWGGGINFMNILTSTPPRTELKPTKIVIPGNPQIVDGATYANYDYSEDYGLLVVDADGKVWSWGTRRNMDAPVSTFASGSVPITPTEISALSGVVIKRISINSSGSRALALSDAGNVYQWDGTSRTPALVSGLAGIAIKNIWASGDVYAALSASGALYTWGGYGYSLGRVISSSDCYWCTDTNVGQATIADQVADVSAGFSRNISVATALTTTGKLFSWGNFKTSQVFLPEESTLPGSRTPSAIGSSGSSIYVVATDKTWWRQALDVNLNIVYYSVTNIPTDVRNAFSGFSSGTATGVVTTNSNLYTLYSENAGTCGSVGAASRVMSDGQFGLSFADDSIDLEIIGDDISRPNTDNFFDVIASSRCFGSTGVIVTADLTGGGTYSSALSSTAADDGSSVNARFKFNPSTNGALYIRVKATTSASVVGTQSYYTLVVPLPPAGRKIGVSVNAGARYTNSSNVVLDLVWPDGVYKIFVSNDGGFAPGTVTEIDLQTQINWVLPPQAVIPLASIVYARFGEENNYYFDDIIIDSISPVLTFASAR